MLKKKIEINHHLFYETSHSPSLVDIVGEKMLGKVIDFCFIENPYYPGKHLLKKLQRKLRVVIKSYPSSNPILAQKDLAAVIHAKSEHIIIGNGATELITVIQNQLVENIGIPVPTFSEYIDKLQSFDQVKLFQLPSKNQYQLDLTEYSKWIRDEKLSAALIINPGNPTGQFIPTDKMVAFLEQMRHLRIVLVDESFIDFSGEQIPSLIPFVERFPNLIIVRSMSKHCGVPGLRLGYCCTSNEEFLQKIRRVLPIWNINTLAEYFLTQLKDTNAEYQIARKRVIADVQNLYQQLKPIRGFEVYPTGSNFILLKITTGATAYEVQMKLLEEYGVYVRDCSNKVGLDKYHIRVASKGRKKDKFLIRALTEIFR
jgi:histidinol-phosphate/aromatic aminotransferase/cobyric acid decarboxylase-like protein